MRRFAAIALAALITAAPAHAQEDEGVVVETLVVTAIQPGPAWWKVEKGEAVVFILGLPSGLLPRDLSWDRSVVERRLDGAKALILPSVATAGIRDIPGLLRLRGKLKSDEPLEGALQEPLKGRFIRTRTALKQPAERYAKLGPYLAGDQLLSAYMDTHRFRAVAEVDREIAKLARKRKVKIQRNTYKAAPMLKNAVGEMRTEEDKALACFAGFIEAAEQPPERFRRSSRAWADGEVRQALDVVRGPDVCNALFLDRYVRSSIDDQVAAIEAALRTPGKSVALVPLRRLVVADGVVDQLSRRGYEVTDPSSLRD